jgi:hypothetical protein
MSPALKRLMTGTLIASLSIASIAPAAYAGQGWGHAKKYRRFERVTYCPTPVRVVERVHTSNGAPALAGFIGGLAVGAIIASQTPVVVAGPPPVCVEPASYYEDAYCGARYSSLDSYLCRSGPHPYHPRIVRVVSVRTGECVQVVRYIDGRWYDWDEG